MLQKNIDKKKRSERPNQWRGFSPKVGLTKHQKLDKIRKKHKED